MPFDCRSGGCGECKGDLLNGEVRMRPFQESALTRAEQAAGKVLFCCAEPTSDLEIAYVPVPGARPAPLRQYGARVTALERLAPDVMKVMLRVEDGGKLRWHAGQYIDVLVEGGQKRSFSFATGPHVRGTSEVHIPRRPGGLYTTRVFETMKAGDFLRFEGPLGAFHLREAGAKPIIFVAGSTGFAPVKSMVEYAFHAGLRRPMYLYWGVKSVGDFYMKELPERWAREHANFKFVPVLSEPAPGDHWTGRMGTVHEAILHDFPVMTDCEVYACGSVAMVESAHAAFLQKGMTGDRCFSDAFNFAPHIKGQGSEIVQTSD